jgi:zinc protease
MKLPVWRKHLYNVREMFLVIDDNEMINMRFSDKAREQSCPYIKAWVELIDVGESSRFYLLGSVAKENNLQDTIKTVLDEKERILQYGWTNPEIDRAKASVISYYEKNASEKRVESSLYLNAFIGDFLDQTIVADDKWRFNAAEKMFPLITQEELNNTFKEYFKVVLDPLTQ